MTAEHLFANEAPENPAILSFAAPTGGLGTTLLATNLGIQLAKKGRSVLVADLALTEATCHLALGMLRPERHLGMYLGKEVANLKDAIVQTSVNNLSLLAGCPDSADVANIAYLSKQKLISDLKDQRYDYVLVDAGSGTGADTLDFFLAAQHAIAVVQTTSVGLEPFYRFFRAFLHRLLMEGLNKKRYQALAPGLDPRSPLTGLWDMPETREEDLAAVERAIEARRFAFVQTGLTSEKDQRMGHQLEALLRRNFLCPVRFLGGIDWDAQAAAAHRAFEPIAKAYPMCAFSLAVERLANLFLKEEREPSPAQGHLDPRPVGEMDAYELLELPYSASVKDIQVAYGRLLEPYLETSPLTLALYTKDEREAIRDRLEDAYKLLINTGLRQRYDDDLIAKGRMAAEERVEEYGEPATESTGSGTVTGGHAGEDAPQRSARNIEAVLEEIQQFDGKALRRVREARGISVAEIVSETNIRTWYIECIEAERFDALPALIYLKGFLKQIAVYLGLDPHRVLADYIARYHAATRSSQQQGK
jgi:flagellar biosynthesis protein FlhG